MIRRLTKEETKTAKELLRARVARNNYGMLYNTDPCIPLRDHMAFNNEGWEIDKNMSYIFKDGAPAYKIKKQYGRGGRELLPKLEYIGA